VIHDDVPFSCSQPIILEDETLPTALTLTQIRIFRFAAGASTKLILDMRERAVVLIHDSSLAQSHKQRKTLAARRILGLTNRTEISQQIRCSSRSSCSIMVIYAINIVVFGCLQCRKKGFPHFFGFVEPSQSLWIVGFSHTSATSRCILCIRGRNGCMLINW
jgi:hypothetical protein